MSIPLSLWALFALGISARAAPSSSDDASDLVSVAWYTGWHAEDYPPSNVSWSKYSLLHYAFAVTVDSPDELSLEESDESLLPEFVKTAHENGVKAGLSIGGWTGSRFFSTNFGSSDNRTAFVKTVTNLANQYNLDALDFDWEFPGLQGMGCNTISPDDVDHFTSFLNELRQTDAGSKLLLTAATSIMPYHDSTGNISTNLTAWAEPLDYVALMNYDVFGPATSPFLDDVTGKTPHVAGPSAPLADACAPQDSFKRGSATSGTAAWISAGVPAHKILLGVPSYAHSFEVKDVGDNLTTFYPEIDQERNKNKTAGDAWDPPDAPSGVNVCGDIGGPGGSLQYWGLIQQGYLSENGTAARSDLEYKWDGCSQSPFIYDASKQLLISYEDQRSIALKGNFIHDQGLAGFAMWEAGGDKDDQLLDAITSAAKNGNSTINTDDGTPKAASGAASTSDSNSALRLSLSPALSLAGLLALVTVA
ncbi:glycoside hydrolase family 18 protein [Schizophyllum commune]